MCHAKEALILAICLLVPTVVTVAAAAEPGRFSLGAGAYFLEPHERAGLAGTAPPVHARPIFSFREERRLRSRLLLEPRLAIELPGAAQDGGTALAMLANADVGYRAWDKWAAIGGLGVQSSWLFGQSHDVDIGGHFVTPSGGGLTWLFTVDAGVAYWLDPHFRLDLSSAVARLLDDTDRKFRFGFEAAYAL